MSVDQPNNDFAYISAVELLKLFRDREVSPVEVIEKLLERIERLNPKLNAFMTLTPELALEQARVAEQAYKGEGNPGQVAGIPVAIKDLSLTRGVRTTMGSLPLTDWIPEEDGPDVERLLASGMVMVGKTNAPEYGWKGDSGNRIIGPTHNPWNVSRTAGGSSGGSGAAVASGMVPLAQGSDGAGSIRIPASFCGIFGLKPSHSLVPRYPSRIPPYSHIGPMTRSVRDAALLLSVTAGADERDRYSYATEIDYLAELDANPDISGLRIAWSPDLGYVEVNPEVREIAETAARRFADLGCDLAEDHPTASDPWPIMEVIFAMSQLSNHLDDFEEVREQLDPGRVRLLEMAQTISGMQFLRAQNDWDAYYHVWRLFMQDYDLLLTPTIATPPFATGEDKPGTINGKATTYLGWTGYSYPFNLTGQPAATVPCGFTSAGLPVGLQIVGRWRDDITVLRAAAAFEEAQPWAQNVPDLD